MVSSSRPLALLVWHVCLLAALVGGTAPSVFRVASPYVYLAPPYPLTSKLLLTDGTLTLDTDNGYFTLSLSELFSQQGGPTVALTITMRGNVTFSPPSLMLFGFPSSETAYCSQSPSSPPLCPTQQQYVNGPFNFGAYPASGASTALILEEQPYVNPSTGQAMNFLFASQPLTWQCNGTCVDLHTLVPPAPLPANASFTTLNATTGYFNQLYQALNQVTDTLTCVGLSCTKSNNAYLITVNGTTSGTVTGVAGTASQITVACNATNYCTVSLPSAIVAPGTFTATGLVTGSRLYNSASGSPNFNLQYGPGAWALTTGQSNYFFGGGTGVTSGNQNVVVGSGLQSGSQGASKNTALGYQAGRVSNCTDGCTFVGANAGFNLAQVSSGAGLTVMGSGALFTASYCFACTVLGDRAAFLYNATQGSNQQGLTAVGGTVYSTLLDGDGMTGMGWQAGGFLIHGSYCTALGNFAMQNWRSCSSDTAVGSTAMYSTYTYPSVSPYDSGGDNTAVGAAAMRNITTGAKNTAVGSNSLSNVNASTNTACYGYSSCFSYPVNALGVTALGAFATPYADVNYGTAVGFLSSVGFRSVAIGVNASATGDTSIVIGSQASDAGFANCIALGTSAVCQAAGELRLSSGVTDVYLPTLHTTTLLTTLSTPASSSAACTTGQLVFDSAFIYTCVATNTWRRVATSSF